MDEIVFHDGNLEDALDRIEDALMRQVAVQVHAPDEAEQLLVDRLLEFFRSLPRRMAVVELEQLHKVSAQRWQADYFSVAERSQAIDMILQAIWKTGWGPLIIRGLVPADLTSSALWACARDSQLLLLGGPSLEPPAGLLAEKPWIKIPETLVLRYEVYVPETPSPGRLSRPSALAQTSAPAVAQPVVAAAPRRWRLLRPRH